MKLQKVDSGWKGQCTVKYIWVHYSRLLPLHCSKRSEKIAGVWGERPLVKCQPPLREPVNNKLGTGLAGRFAIKINAYLLQNLFDKKIRQNIMNKFSDKHEENFIDNLHTKQMPAKLATDSTEKKLSYFLFHLLHSIECDLRLSILQQTNKCFFGLCPCSPF